MVQKKMSQPKKPEVKSSSRSESADTSASSRKKVAVNTDKNFSDDMTKKGAKASGLKSR